MRIRTGYSFRTAVGSLKNVAEVLKESGATVAPITDRASTFGYVKWRKECEKQGLRPIYGIELAVAIDIAAKKPTIDHWTFIAKDSLVPIHKLLEKATSQFRYEPLLTYDDALAADCFKIIGHASNVEILEGLLPEVDNSDIFYALSPSIPLGQFRRYEKLGIAPIACADNKYPRIDDLAFYEVLCGRNASTQTYAQHIVAGEEWQASLNPRIMSLANERPESGGFTTLEAAIENLNVIATLSTATLKKGHLLEPEKPKSLRQMCEEGAEMLGCDLSDPVYAERLDKELSLIEQKEFEDYFYIITDMIKFAREEMIVGPARGSSCGSLVCYLLEITTIDPIPYGLIFERFIDINRDDLPDIDIDFSDQKRQLVFDYMADKYGQDHIARLGTVAMYQPRSAVAEAGAALKIPRWKCDKALDALIERSSGDSRALDTLEDTLRTTPNGKALIKDHPEVLIATKMEGHPRHHSQHAAGIILTDKPVVEYVATDSRSNATHCDKKDAEELDLLKIDALGLTQLSVFEDALEMAGLHHKYLESIPLDDPKAFEILNRGHFSGIFQFMGPALQTTTKMVKVNDINDIIAITALARPGPLASGGTNEWIRRKNGAPVTYPHPLFEPYMQDTMGIVIYQEQVMEIGRQIGDLSWADVTALRKAMSKSLGKEYFDQFGDRWKSAASAKGIPDDVLTSVWDDLCAYGAWAFNKSHSVAYGLISYQCCWLKAHYPLEFAAATLNHETDPMKQIAILRELYEEGINYVPVDAEISTDKWQVDRENGRLVGPVQNVKGIGPKMVQQIVSARARNEPMPPRAAKLLHDPKTPIDTLWPVTDRVKAIMPDPAERNIITPPRPIGSIDESHKDHFQALIIGVVEDIKPIGINEPVQVAKRGGKILKDGPQQFLNIRIADDSGKMYCRVDRFKWARLAKPIIDRGRPNSSIWCLKGKVLAGMQFMMVEGIRYIGDMDENYDTMEENE